MTVKRTKKPNDPSVVAKNILKEFNESKENKQRTYEFTLIISKPPLREEIAANSLYQNGCGDALFSVSNGVYEVEFARESSSLEAAINSAISNIYESKIGSHIIGIKLNLRHEKLQ